MAIPKRQKLLGGALALIGIMYAADSGFKHFYERPRDARLNETRALQGRLSKATDQLDGAGKAARRLDGFEQRSLPRDLQLAHSRYQSWLLGLAEQSGLKGAGVNANSPSGRGTIRRIVFSLRGQGTMAQVTNFLYQFYSAGHLQRIQSLTLTPSASTRTVDLGLTIEAVSLQSAVSADSLTELPGQELASASLEAYNPILRRDFFTPGGRALQAREIVLSAITYDTQGNLEAWFRRRGSNKTQIATAGTALDDALFDVQVVEIQQDQVKILLDGQPTYLDLGQSLADVLP